MSHYIPPLLSATTFFFSAGGSEHARGPLGVCAEWYMRFFLRTVVTVLLLPKSWKKGNSKLQSEASWTVRRGVVTQRYADVSCKVTEKGRELWEKEVRKNSTVKKNLNTDNFNCWRHSDLIFGLYFSFSYKAHTSFHICTLEECGDCAAVEGSWFSRPLMLPLVSHLPLSTDILSAWNLFSSPGLVTTWPQHVCVYVCVREREREREKRASEILYGRKEEPWKQTKEKVTHFLNLVYRAMWNEFACVFSVAFNKHQLPQTSAPFNFTTLTETPSPRARPCCRQESSYSKAAKRL